ncbi:MAG: hypothetical protein R3F12_00105 [Lysobacteraceae bacterium]
MALYLVAPGVELTLELFVANQIEEAVTIQFERIKDRHARDIFVRKLEQRLDSLLGECLDWDLREPSEAQRSYAKLISKQLGVPIPSEAWKFRFHMALFLEAYAQQARFACNRPTERPHPEYGAEAARRLVERREAAATEEELIQEPPDLDNAAPCAGGEPGEGDADQ